jgi:hypothetical protein
MRWVIWPASRLKVTPLSNVAEPSQTGPPSVPISRTFHKRTCWRRSALPPFGFSNAKSSRLIQLLRREEKFNEAAKLMLAAPKDPNRLHNLDEWWIERRLLARKMLDVGEHRSAYLIARDAALPSRDIYKPAPRRPAPPIQGPPSSRPAITASWRAPSSDCRRSS